MKIHFNIKPTCILCSGQQCKNPTEHVGSVGYTEILYSGGSQLGFSARTQTVPTAYRGFHHSVRTNTIYSPPPPHYSL